MEEVNRCIAQSEYSTFFSVSKWMWIAISALKRSGSRSKEFDSLTFFLVCGKRSEKVVRVDVVSRQEMIELDSALT